MSIVENFSIIKQILFFILEFWFVLLKVLYYICEATYTLIVPKPKKNVSGEIVLITGAGHGIGKELAIGYATLGATVVCWDINKETNEQTTNEIKGMGKSSVYAYRCDVSEKDEVFKMAEKVKKEVGDVTILINNAAIAPCRTFLNYTIEEISKVIDVNLMAHYWTIKAFLPSMIENNHGHIVAMASILALRGFAYGTLYSTTKAAVQTLMECINDELRMYSKGKSAVKTTTILPALVTTGLAKPIKIRFPRIFGVYSPQQMASFIINAQRRDYREQSYPSFWLSVLSIGKLLPDNAQMCILDFFRINFDEED